MFYYRVVSTGEVLGAAHSKPQDADWIAAYAAALGEAGAIECFESDADPRPVDARTEPAPASVPPPDPNAFKRAVMAYLGAAAVAPPLLGFVTFAIDALNQGDYALVRSLIEQALAAGALTQEQHNQILAYATEYHIP